MLTKEKAKEIIQEEITTAFDNAMVKLGDICGCVSGDCEPLVAFAIDEIIEKTANDLVKYAIYLCESNKA